MRTHPRPWAKLICCMAHEALHCLARQALGDEDSFCASMVGEKKMSKSFRELRGQLLLTYPFMSDLIDICE
uniref:SprT-like domain-containing protein n=1 Tax=Globodera pallida TaxID=36090 RepID=A0A183BUW8_GLOPA